MLELARRTLLVLTASCFAPSGCFEQLDALCTRRNAKRVFGEGENVASVAAQTQGSLGDKTEETLLKKGQFSRS